MNIVSDIFATWGIFDVTVVLATVVTVMFMVHAAEKKWQQHQAGIKLPPKVSGGWPWLGHAHEFAHHPREFLERCRKKYGDIFRFTSHGYEVTMVCGQSDLLRRFFKGGDQAMSFLAALRFSGIDVANGWDINAIRDPKSHVMAITKQNYGVIRGKFIPQFRKFASQFQPEIEYTAKQRMPGVEGVFDSIPTTRELVGRMSLRVVGGPDAAHNEHLRKAIYEFADATDDLRTQWFRREAKPTTERFAKLRANSFAAIGKILAQRRQWQKEDPEHWMEKHGLNDYFSHKINSLPYEEGKRLFGFSEQEVDGLACTQVQGMMYAAMANTTQAIEFCMLNILADRKVYDAACEEVARACSMLGPDGRFDESVLAELEFLEACFYEGNRVGVFPMMLRDLLQPFELDGGYKLPAGSFVAVSPMTIHLDPKLYPEPLKFNPWRMMGEEGATLRAEKSYAFLTFSSGRHECLGRPMAEMEFKLTMAELLRKYDLEIIRGDDGLLVPEPDHAINSIAKRERSTKIKYKLRETPLGSS